MFTAIGDQTKTLFLKGPEAHKLHHEFTVATGAVVHRGQQVVLEADGTISPVTYSEAGSPDPVITATPKSEIIGVSIHNGLAGELVTVAMVGYTIIYAMADGELDAGPVMFKEMSDEEGNEVYPVYTEALDAATTQGWALDAAEEEGDVIRVALF